MEAAFIIGAIVAVAVLLLLIKIFATDGFILFLLFFVGISFLVLKKNK